MKRISLLIFVVSFLLYRPYVMQQTGMLYKGDDEAYLSYATSIAYFQFPSLKKELIDSPAHFIGSGVLAAPFVFAFSLIDRVCGSNIVVERTAENVTCSWTLFGFVFASIFYFWIACFLLYRAIRFVHDENIATLAVVLMVLIQGVPLYAFRRPVFSHVFEFFVQSALVYVFVYQNEKSSSEGANYYPAILVGLLIGMLTLVRFNDALYALVWPISIWAFRDNRFNLSVSAQWKKILSAYGILILPLVLFIVLPGIGNNDSAFMLILYKIENYASGMPILIKRSFEIRRIFHTLFGLDWGLIFSAPFVVISIISIFFIKSKYPNPLLLMLLPIGFNLSIFVITRHGQGSWYGYRYFLFSAIPVLVMPMAFWIERMKCRYGRTLYWVIAAIATFPLLSMLCFEGNPNNLTLHLSDRWGGWQNPTYQLEVWKTLLFNPFEFVKATLKGGPLYLVYLFTGAFNVTHLLPEIVRSKYPVFQFHVLIKSIIIYSSPFIFFFILKKWTQFQLMPRIRIMQSKLHLMSRNCSCNQD